MTTVTAEEIVEATGGRLISESPGSFPGVSIDSRTISKGEVFFALRGPSFDGHDFLDNALSKGNGAVIESKQKRLPEDKTIIYVGDTLKALQDLAHFLRMRQDVPVVAITGSNGKTTTKEMISAVLSRKFRVLKNEGNFNNHVGLPLSLTRISAGHEAVVLELGMNSPGEIKRLCEIAVPSHGVITNIGLAHIGGLGDLESVRSAKLEILEGLTVVVLNADDSFLMQGVKGFKGKIITFSINPAGKSGNNSPSSGAGSDSSVIARDVCTTGKGSDFLLQLRNGESISISLNVHGLFNVYNALAAAAVCHSLGIGIEDIKTALEAYTAFPMRFEVMEYDNMTLINDSYNANPSSMGESLKELMRIGRGRRTVAVLGDMFELGDISEKEHRDIGTAAAEMGVDVFVAVGEMMKHAAEENQRHKKAKAGAQKRTFSFKSAEETGRDISGIVAQGDVVLIKGSRIMNMETIVERIKG